MRFQTEKIGIHILAFLVARCRLLGMYPFVVPFFMAAYLQGKSSFTLYLVLMAGVFSMGGISSLLKYTMVICFLMVLFGRTSRKEIFSDHHQMALASGMILWAIAMPYQYLLTGKEVAALYALLEGIIAGCFVLIYEQGFVAFRVGTSRMFSNNERFIGLFAFMITALFGCPGWKEPVNLLYVLSMYLVLYCGYRFDSGVGIAAGSAAGLVLAFRMQNVQFLAVMILMSGLIVLLKELGKSGVMLAFLGGDLLMGFLYEKSLFSTDMLTGAMTVLVLFWITPSKWMKRTCQVREGMTRYSQDILIQEATRNRIRDFGQAFLAMEKMLVLHEEKRDEGIPNGLSNMYLSGDGISLLNAVESQSNRLAEMRKNFIRQLGQIGEVITTFPSELTEKTVQNEFFEGRLTERLAKHGVVVTKAVCVKEVNDRNQVYVSCYLSREQTVKGKFLAEQIGKMLGCKMICVNRGEDPVTGEESRFCFVERGKYMLTTGIVRRNRSGESKCGDNFSVTKLDTQKAILMLSDGMGSGESAYIKSEQVVELLEQFLQSGFCRELAIELLNSFISFLADGSGGSTLDLTMIDFYTGTADFIKLGASTTFIKRKGQVECIRSTSLPMGVMEQVEFDTCARKLYHGDIIVMISDGVLDGIMVENKEEYLADLIGASSTNNAQQMAEQIMQDVEKLHRDGLKDDSTVLVAGVWEY